MSRSEPVALVTSDGIQLAGRHYQPSGSGRPDDATTGSSPYDAGVSVALPVYLVAHGFTGWSGQPRVTSISERVVGSGSPVLALDLRGHGASGGRSSVGVTETADVAAGVEWLARRWPDRPIVLLGFSMGASIVVRHAGLGGRCDAVIAVSGPGRWYERRTKSMYRVNLGLETRLGRLILRYAFKVRIGGGWDTLPDAPVQLAAGISVPFLVVHGDADSYFDLSHPRMLASMAPTAQLWIEPGMGHAENATTPALVDRMLLWARAALDPTWSETMLG